jgi:nucleotide-binding universal stress UspA family protein
MATKILFPTDGSDAARRAAEMISDFARQTPDTTVTAVVVISPFHPETSDLDPDVIERQNAQMRRHADETLTDIASLFAARGVAHTTKTITGNPVSQAIADEAEAGGYTLIALGSHGMGMSKLDRRYVGSVAENVLRRVSLPTLVLPVHRG